jgi:hypothetical protein
MFYLRKSYKYIVNSIGPQMALFSLTDINFKPDATRNFKSLNSYSVDNKRYPIDLGATDKGHYMMFFINVQRRTQFEANYDNSGAKPTVLANAQKNNNNTLTGALSNVGEKIKSVVSSSISGLVTKADNEYVNKASDAFGQEINAGFGKLKEGNLFRSIKRTKDTIALYMPDTLNFNYQQSYSDVSLTDAFGIPGALAQGAAAGLDAYNDYKATGRVNLQNMSPFAVAALTSNFGGSQGPLFTALTSATGGVIAQNPQLELIYSKPQFRQFRFSFMFYPRSQREAREVIDIIEMFKYHQAPELLNGTYGRFLVPPSEFDIQFMYNGQENVNIPKVSTCVLTGLDINYAPTGTFAAYETIDSNSPSKGGTGMPVGIGLDLSFTETEIITKNYYNPTLRQNAPNQFDIANGGV